MITDGDTVLVTPEAIENHILDYFSNIFGNHNACMPNSLISEVILSLVTTDDNFFLTNLPLALEIKTAVFDLNDDGPPGLDGYGGHFYQFFWDIIEHDVVMSVQHFFQTCSLLSNLNSNTIILIPKVKGATSMGDFWPIALANFQFKIITKILADRLASITSRIISPNQQGFIRDKHISDCVILASEAINVLDRKQFGG